MPKHFVLHGFVSSEPFKSPAAAGGSKRIPHRDRAVHGVALGRQLEDLKPRFEQARLEAVDDDAVGLMIEFEGFPGIQLAFESLAREAAGIELINVRLVGESTLATVFVPDGKLRLFEGMIESYLSERRDRNGRPLDYQRLIDTIQNIRAATLRSMWTDMDPFPLAEDETFWWEIWLPVRRDRDAVVSEFRRRASAAELRVARGELGFPERTVLLVYASAIEMRRSPALLNVIAEVRRAKETAEFFDSLLPLDQVTWSSELLARTTFPAEGEDVPHVCVLDTGVNRGHQLLTQALANPDLHTVEPGWGVSDIDGHGTSMAGLALLGDLTPLLDGSEMLSVSHRLESVKLLSRDGANEGDARHHGFITKEAVARPEITTPYRSRVFSLAVSSQDGRDRGRPSAWSSAIDDLAANTDGDGGNPRLILVAAGNAAEPSLYPTGNSTDAIHDPGQAWNALTVGAYTALARITEDGAGAYVPLARAGGLSPHSTSSATWQSFWPLKPDVVFEGGNVASDGNGALTFSSLSLLTTGYQPDRRPFTTADATSAATSIAARMAAEIRAAYPSLRPETVRALIVQSAEWTAEMKRMYLSSTGIGNKEAVARLVRHCGFGVPSISRARESVANSLSLIVEDTLVPFHRRAGEEIQLKEMHLHELPWPREELESLGEIEVEMRVTLSYFIEPNPSAREHRSRYRYQSHGLRFDVRRPTESTSAFRARINRAVTDEENENGTAGDDGGWVLGKKARHRGSLHSDAWRGSAADLASRGVLAVYPAMGWWRTRQGLKRWDSPAPYSLVVSINTPETGVDLYAAIANRISIAIGDGE